MKKHYMRKGVVISTIASLIILIVSIVNAGSAGFTYNINHNGYSQYNIHGFTQSDFYFGKYQFRTYSVHIAGLQRFLDRLVIRGRTWQAQLMAPGSTNRLCIKVADTQVVGYNNYCTACNETRIMELPVPILSNGPHYAVGKHRLVQQGATNTEGSTPSPFYTYSGGNGTVALNYFSQAAGLTCIFPVTPPPSFNDDLE